MTRPTLTVETSYVARDGTFRVFLRGIPGPVIADAQHPDGTAVHIIDGKAVKAS